MGLYVQTGSMVVWELASTRYLGIKQVRTLDWIEGGNIVGDSSPPVFGVNETSNEN